MGDEQKDFSYYFEHGENKRNARNNAEAIAYYDIAIKLNPEYTEWQYSKTVLMP